MEDTVKYGVQLKTFVDINGEQYCVSTVDLGGNILPYAGYETMVFYASDYKIYSYSELDEFTRRYPTQQQAIVGHYATIDKLIEKLNEEEIK